MKVLRSLSVYVCWKKTLSSSKSIGFVPTMGALHDGHLSLVEASTKNADITVVSIFINPKQFSENEDFNTYPRDLENDLNKLKDYNVSAVFVPSINDIYETEEPAIIFDHPFAQTLEGASRPHFFPGVIDVVSRLFNIVQPNYAHFGRKDAQQLILIQKMVDAADYPITIIPGETVREPGGLAMSSRNEYLTSNQKRELGIIWESLGVAKKMLDNGDLCANRICGAIENTLKKISRLKIDYVSIVDIENLKEVSGDVCGDVLISLAVSVGGVRLIDNIFYAY